MDTLVGPLDVVKNTISEAKNTKFTHKTSSNYTNSTSSKIPLIQQGHCVFIVTDKNEKLQLQEPVPHTIWSISKIPRHIRESDDNAYTPRLVSIGPLHYKKLGFEFMDVQKQRFLDRLLKRCSYGLETIAKELEEETRRFYSDNFNHIDSDSFVKMMILDGCFVIEFLRLGGRSFQGKLADDPIFATRWMQFNLGLDILLLENQLPLFLLHRFFKLTSSNDEDDCLVSLALRLFMTYSPGENAARMIESHDTNANSPHLLALFHNSFTPKDDFQLPAAQVGNSCLRRHIVYAGKGWINDATILNLSGIRFKPKPGNILDIEFKKKELNIPPIFIDHTRTTVLRNF